MRVEKKHETKTHNTNVRTSSTFKHPHQNYLYPSYSSHVPNWQSKHRSKVGESTPVEEVAFDVGGSAQGQARAQASEGVAQGKVHPSGGLCSEEGVFEMVCDEWARYSMCGHGLCSLEKVSF